MKMFFTAAGVASVMLLGGLAPSGVFAQENGVGADPDRDGNPATNTRAMARIGDPADEKLDAPFRVITFEPPPGKHGDKISNAYAKEFGVTFSDRLTRQICEGQRYFQYDSLCTYLAPPSGAYAAVYRDDWKRPLSINFATPVCAASLAVYPTGGKEGEKFKITLQPWNGDTKLSPARINLTWTKDTFRWRSMVGAFFNGVGATRVDVMVEGSSGKTDFVQFLVDDVAFVESGCEELLGEIENAAGYETADGELNVVVE
ncbi:MAG: hypothetical protein KDA46_01495 [Parvularculaceae bacterium]|nr:hypothetical protein [Parvularculaceae bacterium]